LAFDDVILVRRDYTVPLIYIDCRSNGDANQSNNHFVHGFYLFHAGKRIVLSGA